MEEGFTPDDDVHWQGTLPQVWASVLHGLVHKTELLPENTDTSYDSLLTINIATAQGYTVLGTPDNFQQWEYQLQELVQGIYEASQREYPLRIGYLDYSSNGNSIKTTLEASFQHRLCTVTIERDAQTYTQNVAWSTLQSLLEILYLPDYHPELGTLSVTRKVGQYIDPGDGQWYQLGKAVTNPGKKDVINQVRQAINRIVATV